MAEGVGAAVVLSSDGRMARYVQQTNFQTETLGLEENMHTGFAHMIAHCKTTQRRYQMMTQRLTPMVLSKYEPEHRERLKRFLPLAAMDDRTTVFLNLADDFDWGARTRATYWQCILTGRKITEQPLTVEDNSLTAQLGTASRSAESWDLEDPESLLSDDTFRLIIATASDTEPQSTLRGMAVAAMMGQRPSDIAKLDVTALSLFSDRVAVTFTKFKTSKTKCPYTIHLPRWHAAADFLVTAAHSAQHNQIIFPLLTPKDIHRACGMYRIPTFDVRALRRSGLCRLAAAGMDMPDLLRISQHTAAGNLELYLGRGVFNTTVAHRQLAAFSQSLTTIFERPQCVHGDS